MEATEVRGDKPKRRERRRVRVTAADLAAALRIDPQDATDILRCEAAVVPARWIELWQRSVLVPVPLTSIQAAALVGVTDNEVWKWAVVGASRSEVNGPHPKLPATKNTPTGRLRINPRELAAFLRLARVETPAATADKVA